MWRIEFWSLAKIFIPLIRKITRTATIIVDTVDIHFIREIREAELANNSALLAKALTNKEAEISTYKLADRLWVVTDNDKEQLGAICPAFPLTSFPMSTRKWPLKKL